jgi:outer membrane protein OmpA-like peptidoglycan-associated protein
LKESGEIISRIYFNFDDSLLTERSKYTLDQIFNRIKENNRHLTVIGHTDSRGSKEYNYQLGLKRSHGTMEYLIKNGVESSRFTAVSKGEMEPVVSNDTSDGREKNRRVDIHM